MLRCTTAKKVIWMFHCLHKPCRPVAQYGAYMATSLVHIAEPYWPWATPSTYPTIHPPVLLILLVAATLCSQNSNQPLNSQQIILSISLCPIFLKANLLNVNSLNRLWLPKHWVALSFHGLPWFLWFIVIWIVKSFL